MAISAPKEYALAHLTFVEKAVGEMKFDGPVRGSLSDMLRQVRRIITDEAADAPMELRQDARG